MREETYQIRANSFEKVFEFTSEGPKGSIKKRIVYEDTNIEGIYNLAFGDVDAETDDFDDKVISDNEDAVKVLATVAETVFIFLKTYPNAAIRARGSNFARTRLYRIGISNNLEEIINNFDIYGLLEGIGWVRYEKNKNYSAFLIKNK
jgi:hypothetical protein